MKVWSTPYASQLLCSGLTWAFRIRRNGWGIVASIRNGSKAQKSQDAHIYSIHLSHPISKITLVFGSSLTDAAFSFSKLWAFLGEHHSRGPKACFDSNSFDTERGINKRIPIHVWLTLSLSYEPLSLDSFGMDILSLDLMLLNMRCQDSIRGCFIWVILAIQPWGLIFFISNDSLIIINISIINIVEDAW